MTNKYDNVSDEKLATDIAGAETMIATYTEERKALLAEIARRYETVIAAGYVTKSHGKVTHKLADFTLEVDTRQTVKWDQVKLAMAAEAMDPEAARHILSVELSVSEKTYNALPPGEIKKALTDARTTKLSAPSIKVVFPKEKS